MGDTPKTLDPTTSPSGRRSTNWSKLVSQARTACQNYLYEEALQFCATALQSTSIRADAEATIRCLMAEAYENLARFTDAVEAVKQYEDEHKRALLVPTLQSLVCLRLGAAYGGTTEIPKAIAFAKQSLFLATRQHDPFTIARSHVVLGTLYRRLGELWFARDHFSSVIKETLRHQNQTLLAQAYNGLGIVCFLEGEFTQARQIFYQAIEALGDADEPLIRGSVDVNLATISTLQGQMHESVAFYESALPHLQRARNPRL
ncbi:MAG TPA: hypothetical protein VFZ34_16235, partial [Blastocatellia bacterium]|nr:hypothetical protein [Blastocatellia bacterium]